MAWTNPYSDDGLGSYEVDGEQYEVVTQTEDDGDHDYVQVNFTSNGPVHERWQLCEICGFEFPQSKVRKIKGKYYCYRYKHYQDAEDA